MSATESPYGHPSADSTGRIPKTVATKAALAALTIYDALRTAGQDVVVAADYSRWIYHPTSVAVDLAQQLAITPTTGAGAWLRMPGTVDVSAPISYLTADAATLITIPVGCVARIGRGYWEVTTAFSGGASSAIGLSSTNTAYNTKGDLLGGASGDVAAALPIGRADGGTVGTKTVAGIFLLPGDIVRFDRITSAFTAGVGRAHIVVELLANLGA